MTSSTMMNGAAIPPASTTRRPADRPTMASSQSQTGTRRSVLATKLDLGETPGDLPRLSGLGGDPDIGRGPAHIAKHCVVHRVAARCLLEGGGVELGDPLEVVLASRQLGPGLPQLRADVLSLDEELESGAEHVVLRLVGRNLQRDLVRELREPADVADDERLAERERADHAARRLPHRRM